MQQMQLWIFLAIVAAFVVCGCILTRKPRKKLPTEPLRPAVPDEHQPGCFALPAALVRRKNVGVSLILDFSWSAFSANRLSKREPAILPLRVTRLQPSPSSRRLQDEWRRTIALARSERGSCILSPGTPRGKFGPKSEDQQRKVARDITQFNGWQIHHRTNAVLAGKVPGLNGYSSAKTI